jgi:hypothetical protein
MAVDHSAMRLGRRHRSPPTPQIPDFGRYAAPLPTAGDVDWTHAVSADGWPLALNDSLGTCSVASITHFVQAAGAYAGAERIATDGEVELAYRGLCGYAGTPDTDRGGILSSVLAGWFRDGVAVGGALDRPLAYARVLAADITNIRRALSYLGPLIIGAELPTAAATQEVWVAPADDSRANDAPGSWGGHACLVVAADDTGATVVTWGALKRLTWGWWRTYVDEAWAILHPAWVASGRAPSGFPTMALVSDLAALRDPSALT